MSLFALFLVLAAALIHATWNYHLKKAAAGRVFWLLCYSATSIVMIPALLIRDASVFAEITPIGWLVICLSAPIHVLYSQILQTGYRLSDYSVVYPTARGTGPLISVAAAVLILGNSPSPAGWCGIAAILAGIVLLTLKPGSAAEGRKVRTGLFWGSLTGCCIAGYTFCDAWAVQQATGLTPLTFYFPSIFMRIFWLAPFVLLGSDWRADARAVFREPVKRRSLAVVTVGSPLAFVLVLYAMTEAPLAYVAPAREVGMMVGVIAGALLLRERLSAARIAGAAAMVLGVLLLALGG